MGIVIEPTTHIAKKGIKADATVVTPLMPDVNLIIL